MRLHQILCQRLHHIKQVCDRLVEEHVMCKRDKSESVAIALRLKMPCEYYITVAIIRSMKLTSSVWKGWLTLQ